jgi:hypothetical protein
MMKMFAVILMSLTLSTTLYAKNTRESLTKKMLSACKDDLSKSPVLNSIDGESIWKNLEDKENGQIKLSKECHMAHEKYEHKFHRVEEEIENHY